MQKISRIHISMNNRHYWANPATLEAEISANVKKCGYVKDDFQYPQDDMPALIACWNKAHNRPASSPGGQMVFESTYNSKGLLISGIGVYNSNLELTSRNEWGKTL